MRHGEREAVELFEPTGQGRAAALGGVGCVALPEDAAGNDVAFAPSGELVVTNYVPTSGPWRIFGSMAEDRIGIARAGPQPSRAASPSAAASRPATRSRSR